MTKRMRRGRMLALVATLGVVGVAIPASVEAAAPAPGWGVPGRRVDLRVLVLDDDTPAVDAMVDQLALEGVPATVVSLGASARPRLVGSYLSDTVSTGPRAKFQAVVLPNEAPAGVAADELAALDGLSRDFGVRQYVASTWANPAVGLRYAVDPGYIGSLDGIEATVTAAAKAGGFGYLDGRVAFEDNDPAIGESYGYLALPLDAADTTSFEPFVTAPIPGSDAAGVLLGVHRDAGRERLVSTFVHNSAQWQFRVLAPGIVDWLTHGVHLGFNRNWFSVHIDDVLLPDARWSTEHDCTVGDNCAPEVQLADSRMTPDDVAFLANWQARTGLYLDLVFNASGSVEAIAKLAPAPDATSPTPGYVEDQRSGRYWSRYWSRRSDWTTRYRFTGTTTVTTTSATSAGADPLTDALLADSSRFRWINHTYSHQNLGCLKAYDQTVPGKWACERDAYGNTRWLSTDAIRTEIRKNLEWAQQHGVTLNPTELVTGEHSGLARQPEQPVDNPNLVRALSYEGIRWIAADASREPNQRRLGDTLTVPRHPMNIFYNAATWTEEIDEYNWIYSREADGGSGICERHPDVTTCIEPLSVDDGRSYLVGLEATIALRHVLTNDPRPHYAHQSNLAEDRILYPVLDELIARYQTTFADDTPLVNPTLTEAGVQRRRAATWAATTRVEAYLLDGRVTIVNRSSGSVQVPVSAPVGTRLTTSWGALGAPFGQAYGGQVSDWRTLAGSSTLRLILG